MNLDALIRQRIKKYGPLGIADYMALCLLHPEHGYYMRRDPLGAQGDFITAPEISQIFGELIGAWLAEQWQAMGRPEVALVELGPGRGTLMSDALRATKRLAGFHDALSVHLVEASPVLKQKQWSALAGQHPRLQWHDHLTQLPPKPLLLIANEFFDALPIQQFIHDGKTWQERRIGMDAQNQLQYVTAQPDTLPPQLQTLAAAAGTIAEYSQACDDAACAIAVHVVKHGGVALIIDYGYIGPLVGDTFQAMRHHGYHNPLQAPGTADLTAHVDFKLLATTAAHSGAHAVGPVPQGRFLLKLGAAMRAAHLFENATPEQKSAMISGLERLTSPEQMGMLFKVLAITHPNHPLPEGFGDVHHVS